MTAVSSQAPAPPRNPAGHAPLRRPGSVRRTCALDSDWFDGPFGTNIISGCARDIQTGADGKTFTVLRQDEVHFEVTAERELLALSASQDWPGLQRMVGNKGGGRPRRLLSEIVPDDAALHSPQYLLLDDFGGASLVADLAWMGRMENWPPDRGEGPGDPSFMKNICHGFQEGSSAFNPDGTLHHQVNRFEVPALPHPDDPEGWHALSPQNNVGMRRARRIDIWREGDEIVIDAHFQDSASSAAGPRIAIHEYTVQARADHEGKILKRVSAIGHVLPYWECPGAIANIKRLEGQRLDDFRGLVVEVLPGTAGCTHLNDMLRALADVPYLAQDLPAA